MVLERDSMQKMNRYGGMGSTCLIPHTRVNALEGLPLIKMEMEGKIMQSMIKLITFASKLWKIWVEWINPS